MRRLLLFLIVFSAVSALPSFASEKEDVKNGNVLYNMGDYSGAAKVYEKAAMEKSPSGIPNFNRGAALYKDGSHFRAIEAFNKSIASGQTDLISAADYNIGNSTYRIGQSKDKADKDKKSIKKTAEIYYTALQYYKRAIDLDPNDKDAKFNYEFVAKKLDELSPLFQIKKEEEKKKEQDKKDQSQQNKDQQQKDQQQGGGQQQDEDQQQDQNQEQKDQQQNKDQQDQQEGQQGEGSGNEERQEGEKPQGGEGQDKSSSGKNDNKEAENKPGEENGQSSGSQQEEKTPDQGQDSSPEQQSKGEEHAKDGAGQSEKEKAAAAQAEEEKVAAAQAEKEAQEEAEKAEALQEEKDQAAQEGQEGEEGKKPDEKKGGLAAYQSAQEQTEAGEMTGQEANMLLEGYKGEEATGRSVKMRQKPINMSEPARDW